MKMKKDDFWIPMNFQQPEKFMGKPIRNLVESGVCTYLIYKGVSITPFVFEIKLIAVLILCTPVVVFGIWGIRGESITQFLFAYYNFRKNRKSLHMEPMKHIETEEEKNEKKGKRISRKENTEAKARERSFEENRKAGIFKGSKKPGIRNNRSERKDISKN